MDTNQVIPAGFVAIGPVEHPRDAANGTLLRNRQTGVYMLLTIGNSIRTVPHKWASDAAAGMGKGADAIQDACIERMTSLGLNPNQIADKLDGSVSRTHVCDFLTRRSSLGSHKLQHLLPALGLGVTLQK